MMAIVGASRMKDGIRRTAKESGTSIVFKASKPAKTMSCA